MERLPNTKQPSMTDGIILKQGHKWSDVKISLPKKHGECKGYVVLSQLSTVEKQQQLNESEDIEIDQKGDAVIRSLKSDAPNGQQFFVERTINMPKKNEANEGTEKATDGAFVMV